MRSRNEISGDAGAGTVEGGAPGALGAVAGIAGCGGCGGVDEELIVRFTSHFV